MSLFARRAPHVEARDLAATELALRARRAVSAGVYDGSISQAEQLAAVWGSVRVIADTVASMPVDVVRGSGMSRSSIPAPVVIADPMGGSMSPLAWRRRLVWSLAMTGNAYALLSDFAVSDSLRRPRRAELVAPDVVTWRCAGKVWTPYVDGVAEQVWPVGRLWHVTAFETPGRPWGSSPLDAAAAQIGIGLASEKFGSDWFTGGGHPTSILRMKGDPGVAGAEALKRRFADATAERGVVVLPEDTTWESVQLSPEAVKFLDAQKFTAQTIAGAIYGVPPEMLGFSSSGESVTYANIADRDLFFLKYGLSAWVARVEDGLSALLPAPQRVKLATGALLRASLSARYQAYTQALVGGWLTVDEVRALEDLDPIGKSMGPVPPDNKEGESAPSV